MSIGLRAARRVRPPPLPMPHAPLGPATEDLEPRIMLSGNWVSGSTAPPPEAASQTQLLKPLNLLLTSDVA